MVNSAGQALLSLPVDSTNKADFSQPPSALAIPRSTVSEFRASTEVELGLNLPSNVDPITAPFNPNKPETYHRTTSLTVYGASGSQHPLPSIMSRLKQLLPKIRLISGKPMFTSTVSRLTPH